jgi:deoxyribodipyrimidine photo-lyase
MFCYAEKMKKILVWIRRDLRLQDHHAMSLALKDASEVYITFNFDSKIIDQLPHADRRIQFIHDSLIEIETELQKRGSSLIVSYGDPLIELPKLAQELKVDALYFNRDYEPYAKERDTKIEQLLSQKKILVKTFQDSVIFESPMVLTKTGEHYKVFTPYKNQWLKLFQEHFPEVARFEVNLKNIARFTNDKNMLSNDWMKKIKKEKTQNVITGGRSEALKKLKKFSNHIDRYKDQRDFPAIDGTSSLSTYIRFGNISIREMVKMAVEKKSAGHEVWLSELIWRDFYQMILDIHPHIVERSFKPDYDKIKWRGSEDDFVAWKNGMTGFPIVDASMRCFQQTGMMHNRLRMIVASFLCKILLVDWRKGEAYFAQELMDFDLAANNGGWQWSSSSGCDAQPYFRIFNPYSQTEKFDPNGDFIRKWIPELNTEKYPKPIVSYEKNRVTCLEMYSVVKKN